MIATVVQNNITMSILTENISALPEPNVHWKDFCDTVVRLGKSTSYSEPLGLADIYQKPYVGNTFCDFTQPAPIFDELTLANLFIERLWAESLARLKNVQLMAKDSTNTSSPPSHDTIGAKAKRNANSNHQPSGKKQGAQRGHNGRWRKQVSYLIHKRHTITEFQRYQTACDDCGKVCKAQFPKGTPQGAFDACVHGVISTFSGRYNMSKRNIKDCLADIFGLTISTG